MGNSSESKMEPKRAGNVFYVGLLSFFGGMSQDMFVPVLPIFLANILGFTKEFIGLTEGILISAASVFRIAAGYFSDKFGKRKPFVFWGYFLSLTGRFLLAFIGTSFGVSFLRFSDGAGKGMKDSPKDALIADSTKTETRGQSFGIVRALDTFGSVVGPLLLFLLLYLLHNNLFKYHIIFMLTAIPLLATLWIIIFKIRESQTAAQEKLKVGGGLPAQFYMFLGIAALFSLGNFSDAFLILRAQNVGVSLLAIPLVYAFFNFIYAAASIPMGSLSDRIGREKVIVLGWLAAAAAYMGLAFAVKSIVIWLAFALYGVYYATTQSAAKALVADTASLDKRGTAYGIYNTVIGLVALPSNFIAGFLWDQYHPSSPFFFGAGISIVSTILLFIFMRRRSRAA